MVERLVANEKVAGSIPVIRSAGRVDIVPSQVSYARPCWCNTTPATTFFGVLHSRRGGAAR